MMDRYDHLKLEQKWSLRWDQQNTHVTDLQTAKKPYYNLMMFPYPSAEGLHVGNVFAFVGSDIHGRFMRTQGFEVFEPMGFDAFGIHSENYAIKVNTHPARLVPQNIENFRENQLKRLGAMFDWSRQVNTTDPLYYRWSQWLFVRLYKAGLAYQKEAPVNWCPSCQTVLSNEQAEGGVCERCSTLVEQREMRQWFFRITAYAEKLLDDLAWIDWSEVTKNAQRRWIGRSEGAEVLFEVEGVHETIRTFTTRPDTLWGATYLVLAPDHPLAERLATRERVAEVSRYLELVRNRSVSERESSTRERSGVFTGAYASNPVNGERLPIWISDYVLMSYGTGAIMAVPAHDQRDFGFAQQFNLPITRVVSVDGATGAPTEAYSGEGVLINSGPFDGLQSTDAAAAITNWLAERNKGRHAVTYRLRDWCISRQRYWGPPIPMIYCDACGVVPVPEDQLPVLLPYLEDFMPDGSGDSPLARVEDFVTTACPECGGPARRETDVSDNFLDSAWYFFRYPSADRSDLPFDQDLTKRWLPVDMYIGGPEHAVLHLMYTRFITMALNDLGLIDFEEPFKRFRAHGLLIRDGAKMSKSKGNVINPDAYLDRYGADAVRTYLMFLGPYLEGGDFRDTGIMGIRRFLERLWRYVTETSFRTEPSTDPATLRLLHQQIKKVTDAVAGLRYNIAIAGLMELFNGLVSQEQHHRHSAETLLLLASPFAPFITHELWERLGCEGMIADAPWPDYDETLAKEETVEVVIQINGKLRDRLRVPVNSPQAVVEKEAFERKPVKKWTSDREVVRKIFIPDKLLNIVLNERGGGRSRND
jgi:leucyl-tRNA synthetase